MHKQLAVLSLSLTVASVAAVPLGRFLLGIFLAIAALALGLFVALTGGSSTRGWAVAGAVASGVVLVCWCVVACLAWSIEHGAPF